MNRKQLVCKSFFPIYLFLLNNLAMRQVQENLEKARF